MGAKVWGYSAPNWGRTGGQRSGEGALGPGGGGAGEEGCAGGAGNHPARQAPLWAGGAPVPELPEWERTGGAAGASSPGEAPLPGTALAGRELPEPALLASPGAAFAGQRCGLLAFRLSQASQVQALPGSRRSSFNPAGTQGGFEG